jgi:hypothetical protein
MAAPVLQLPTTPDVDPADRVIGRWRQPYLSSLLMSWM